MIACKTKGDKEYTFISAGDAFLVGLQARQAASLHDGIQCRVSSDISFRLFGVKLVGELANHKVARQPTGPGRKQW